MITLKTQIANLIFQNYHILPILNRFGIYAGEGNKTVEQICREKDINPDLFIIITNLFIDNLLPDNNKLNSIKISDLLKYLRSSHHHFLKINLPRIEHKINELSEICKDDRSKIMIVKNFYTEFKNELIEHIRNEDITIYPYAEALEKGTPINEEFDINDYLENHSEIEDKIFDIKNLLIRHLTLNKPLNLLNDLVSEIFDFEKELNDHQYIENTVLVPLVRNLQNKAKK